MGANLSSMQLSVASNLPLQYKEGFSFIEFIEKEKSFPSIKNKNMLCEFISFMTHITVEAIQAFKNHEWRNFDALVGENACQIRAAKMKDLGDEYLVSSQLQEELDIVEKQGFAILNHLNNVMKEVNQPFTAPSKFSQDHGILQSLSENVAFVVESFLLTQTKQQCPIKGKPHQLIEKTNSLQLSRFIDQWSCNNLELFSNKKEKHLDTLVRAVQRHLSTLSIKYVHNQASFLENKSIQQLLARSVKQDNFKRLCSPCYYNLDALIQRVIEKKQHILVEITRWTENGEQRVDRIKKLYVGSIDFAYTADPETGEIIQPVRELKVLEEIPLHVNPPPKSVIAIAGNSLRKDQDKLSREKFLKEFNSIPLKRILNANWAQHEQYPRGIQVEEFDESIDPLPKAFAEEAQLIGCSSKNESLFVVNHIYLDEFQAALANEEIL